MDPIPIILSYICCQLEGFFKENTFETVTYADDQAALQVVRAIIGKLKEISPRRNEPLYMRRLLQLSQQYLKKSCNRPSMLLKSLQDDYKKHLNYKDRCPHSPCSSQGAALPMSPTDEDVYFIDSEASHQRNFKEQINNVDLHLSEVDKRPTLSQIESIATKLWDLVREFVLKPHQRLAESGFRKESFWFVFQRVSRLCAILQRKNFSSCPAELVSKCLEMRLVLLRHSLILVNFPKDGMIKKKTDGAPGTKIPVVLSLPLRVFSKLGFNEKDLQSRVCEGLRACYLDERNFAKWRLHSDNGEVDVLSGFPQMKVKWRCNKVALKEDLEFNATDLKLTDTGNAALGPNERVTDRKGIFVFYCDLPLNSEMVACLGERSLRLVVESDSVVPIVHTNQECEAEGTLFVDSLVRACNPHLMELSLVGNEVVPVDIVVDMFSRYLTHFTGKGLEMPSQRQYFQQRLCKEFGSGDGMVYVARLNNAQLNDSTPLSPSSSTTSTSNGTSRDSFWKWFWNCTQLLREKNKNLTVLREMWTEGLIHGFVSKDKAEELCHNRPGAFVVRFGERRLRRVSIQVGNNAWNPYSEDELKRTSLAQLILEYVPKDLRQFAHLYDQQELCDVVLAKYQKFNEQPDSGYVHRGSSQLQDLANLFDGDIPHQEDNFEDLDLRAFEYEMDWDSWPIESHLELS